MASLTKIKQRPLKIGGKRGVRTQFGALCWRVKGGKVRVLLVTTRGAGRWTLPKGWPIDGRTAADSAATEAWEEAGVRGVPSPHCLGIYTGRKQAQPVVVAVFPVEVSGLSRIWPERGQRRRRWFSPKKAARQVSDPELAGILAGFDPGRI